MADLNDLDSLRVVTERAYAETAPPPFDDLVVRARVRRRRRSGAVVAVAAASVGTVVALGLLVRAPVSVRDGVDVPVTTHETTPTQAGAALPPADPRAAAVVSTGVLHNYDVDAQGDLLSTWSSCPDSSSCRYAWRLVRADGSATTGMYPARTGGPHATAGQDYFVATWYTGPQLLIDVDGSASRLAPPTDDAGRTGATGVEPGAATVVTRDGVRLVDRSAGRWLPLEAPTGRPWNNLEVAADGTVWGVDQAGAGGRPTIAWLPSGGNWQEEPLASSGIGALVRSGDRVAALALDQTPPSNGEAPSFGVPSDYAVTTDGGETWTHLGGADLPVGSLESWAATADGTLMVSDGEQVYRSTDQTWQRFEVVRGAAGLNRLQGGDAEHPDVVYGYSYDDDTLLALTSDGNVSAAPQQLR